MGIESRLKRLEKQLGIGLNIRRTILVLCHPAPEDETETEKAEREARIERLIQEAVERDPTNPFILIME